MKKLYLLISFILATTLFLSVLFPEKANAKTNLYPYVRFYMLDKSARLIDFYTKEPTKKLSDADKKERARLEHAKQATSYRHISKTYVEYLNYGKKVSFVLQVISEHSNQGSSNTIQEITIERVVEETTRYTQSGSFKMSLVGSISTPTKAPLNAKGESGRENKLENKLEKSKNEKNKETKTIKIEPGCKFVVRKMGFGFLFNGYATSSVLWAYTNWGEFQYVEHTGVYISYRIERDY